MARSLLRTPKTDAAIAREAQRFQNAVEFNAQTNFTSFEWMMSLADSSREHLFSYGTLQMESVQLATFGRRLEGSSDVLSGFAQSMVRIDDPAVVETSGAPLHPIIMFTGRSSDMVRGTVFTISGEELQRADTYEIAAYKRISVILSSGTRAWVYVDARSASPDH